MKNYTLHQTEIFDEEVEFTYDGFDFTGCEVFSTLRRKDANGDVAHEFDIPPTLNLAVGTATFRLQLSQLESSNLKVGEYYGDIRIKRDSPAYGPYIVANYCIKVVKPSTREE